MTELTVIEMNKNRFELLTGLKELSQCYYLPFTTKLFSNVDDIVLDFLNELANKEVNVNSTEKKAITAIPGIICVVPTFYRLLDFNSWVTEPFRNYKALSFIDQKELNNLFNKRDLLVSNKNSNEISFSGGVTQYLNNPPRNGRLKIQVTLIVEDKIQIIFDESSKLLIFGIPIKLNSEWKGNLNVESDLTHKEKPDVFDLVSNKVDIVQTTIADFSEEMLTYVKDDGIKIN
ncbi:MAG: hypothetical protein IPK08_19780 [Bacteroidetes bacterium]|nr:hypothetical protein [Bacteroidota bacterium]